MLIYNCICLIRGLSNNNFLCCAVGEANDIHPRSRWLRCQTHAPQVVPSGNAASAVDADAVNPREFPILVVVDVNP